jgi:hypothetical protein
VSKSSRILARFRRHVPAELLDACATRAGFGQRRRKCPPDVFFWTLVLGFASESARGLSSLQRFFCAMTKTTITASAFQKRFSPEAAEFLAGVFDHLLGVARRDAPAPVCARLERFRDVYAIDGSLVRLHRKLQRHFRGFRSEGTESMAKLHVVHNLSRRDIERIRISGGRVPDVRGAAFGRWVKGALSLFDLGYYSHDVFRTIQDAGGFFISRMKAHANPRVISVRRNGTMQSIEGVPLREFVPEEETVECDAVFDDGLKARIYRVVGVREIAGEEELDLRDPDSGARIVVGRVGRGLRCLATGSEQWSREGLGHPFPKPEGVKAARFEILGRMFSEWQRQFDIDDHVRFDPRDVPR